MAIDTTEQLRRKAFGVRLKALMDEQGVSVKQLAEVLGVSSGAVSQFRCGYSRPSSDNLMAIAAYLNTSPSYLSYGYADDGGTGLFPLSAMEMAIVRSVRENMPVDSYTAEEKQLINAVRGCHSLTTGQIIEIVGWLSNASASGLVAALGAFKSVADVETETLYLETNNG